MEARRRVRKNKILNDIRTAEVFITRSNETIKRIRCSQMGEVYVKSQMEKLKIAIEEKNALIETLNEELLNIGAGNLDNDIENEYKTTEMKIKKQSAVKAKIIEDKKNEKKETSEKSQIYMQGIINESRVQRQTERDINYAYKYFYKVINSLPPYISKNLAEMPNNKGYIWRGMHFYGDLPEESGPRFMFEKKRGGILVIHEYTDTEYRLYEKEGKNRKQLIHKELRKLKNRESSIMDYMKNSNMCCV